MENKDSQNKSKIKKNLNVNILNTDLTTEDI